MRQEARPRGLAFFSVIIMSTQIINSQLAELAQQIHHGLSRREQSRAAWIEASLELAAAVYTAREIFIGRNIEFGQWWNAQGFKLNHNDRAALVKLGADPGISRTMLEQTNLTSYQKIMRGGFTTHSKTLPPELPPAPTVARDDAPPDPEPPIQQAAAEDALVKHSHREAEISDQVFDYIMAMDKRGEAIPSIEALMVTLGVSQTPIRYAKYALAKIKQEREDAIPDISSFPKKYRDECERFRRNLEKFARRKIDEGVRKELDEYMNEVILPQKRKDQEHYHAVVNAHKGVMKRDVYRKMLACLHPDQSMSAATRAEMFEIWKNLGYVLVGPAEAPITLSTLPASAEAFRARKMQAEAERRRAKTRAASKTVARQG
jgi:hypothetical protein